MSNDAQGEKRVVAHEETGFCRAGREDHPRPRPYWRALELFLRGEWRTISRRRFGGVLWRLPCLGTLG